MAVRAHCITLILEASNGNRGGFLSNGPRVEGENLYGCVPGSSLLSPHMSGMHLLGTANRRNPYLPIRRASSLNRNRQEPHICHCPW